MTVGLRLLAALALIAPLAAAAQPKPVPAPKPVEAPAPEPEGPAYEPQLLQLAEIIGSLAYLRTLCEAPDARAWSERMTGLVEAEGRTPQRRNRLTAAYNRGFKAYAALHRQCSEGSREAAARLAVQGDQLSKALAGRYGG